MPHVTDLRVCKKCKNVFSDKVGGIRSPSTKCPICQESNSEAVHAD